MSAGFFKPCGSCGHPMHGRTKACKSCGKSREEAAVILPAEPAVEPEAVPPPVEPIKTLPALSIVQTAPPDDVPEEYIAMRSFSCRVGDTIAHMKEGQRISDAHAIRELVLQGQPIRPVSEAEGFMTCPCCSQTFRPSPQQLALANAPSAVQPTRVA